jgi:AAHS family 4-hydroxybenzoate transporter-like MFS transporter
MARIDIGRRLDEGKWGGYQMWLVFLTALTIVFDGIDNQLLGVAIPSIMREWSVPRAATLGIRPDGFESVTSLTPFFLDTDFSLENVTTLWES